MSVQIVVLVHLIDHSGNSDLLVVLDEMLENTKVILWVPRVSVPNLICSDISVKTVLWWRYRKSQGAPRLLGFVHFGPQMSVK